jgi:hypothetical protein
MTTALSTLHQHWASLRFTRKTKPIDITAAYVEVKGHLPEQAGVGISCDAGDELAARYLIVDPETSAVDYCPKGGADNSSSFSFKIKPGDTELFQFTSGQSVSRYSCKWDIVLKASVDGAPVDIVVDNNGKLFVTCESSTASFYVRDGNQWAKL